MELECEIVDVDYRIEDGKVYVRAFAKSDGENVLLVDREFLPYLYAVPSQETQLKELKEIVETEKFEDDGENLPVLKTEVVQRKDLDEDVSAVEVYTSIPPKIPKLRREVQSLDAVDDTREFDIPFYKRWLIDNAIYPISKVRASGQLVEHEEFETCIELEDIETLDRETSETYRHVAFDLETFQGRVIMASLWGEDTRRLLTTEEIDRDFVETVEDEAELIQRLVGFVRDTDVDTLTGYNTDEFDFQRLRERAENIGIDLSMGRNGEKMRFKRRGRFSSARLKGRMHLDLYPFVQHVLGPGLETTTLDLDSVAEELLGENKDDVSWEEMKEMWREKKDLERFADYALKDARLAYQLGEQIVPQMMEISRLTGLIPFDACRLTYGQLAENFLVREAYKREMMAPNRPFQQEQQRRRREDDVEGGFVYQPEPGLHDEVAVFDFRSLYPTVMVSHNISPDTLNPDQCSERFEVEDLGLDFCQDEQGFFPELIEGLVEERAGIKDELAEAAEGTDEYLSLRSKSTARKVLANAFYGYLAYAGARWYSDDCASAVTYLGREYIQDSIDTAKDKGFEVVYGDTDSVMLKRENLREHLDGFLENVNSTLPEFMELEFEGYFERGFFTSTGEGRGAKKKYALLNEEGELKIVGFEQVRRDWAPIAKNLQRKVLEKVLNRRSDEAASLVMDTVERLKDGEVPVGELRIYSTLTKEPEEYDSTSPHVEAVKKARNKGDDIEPEATVSYVITRGGGGVSQRAELLKYAESYDPSYYVENQVVPAALRVLKVFGYTDGQLRGEGKQTGLGSF